MSYNKIMNILICTGVYPPDIGGPAKYAKNLSDEFLRRGNKVKVLSYKLEKKLQIGIRHLLYFFRVIFNIRGADFILAMDTFSVGLPSVLAARIFNKKIIIRVGGDFLWETYVEGTGHLITLKNFYIKKPSLPLKYKIISSISKFVLRNASAIVFLNKWQEDIFKRNYELDSDKCFIVENFYSVKNVISGGIREEKSKEKVFLWAGRQIKLKNTNILRDVFKDINVENRNIKLEIVDKISRDELMRKINDCYVVVHPSLSDVAPNFILEAISVGKPFIMTEETGLYSKLKDVGIFIDPFDKEGIKKAVLFVADDNNYDVLKKKIENFNFTHSWQEIASEFLNISEKI